MILGAVLACSASLLYNVGLALQALDAREAPGEESLRPALLVRLVRRPRWLAGTGLNLLGWPLQALALSLAPLAVVQPSLAFGLLALLAIGARTPGVRVGRRDVAATLAILAGVVVVAAVAGSASHEPGTRAELAVVLGALGVLTIGQLLVGRDALVAVAAGCALAWSGLSTKLVVDAMHAGHPGTAALWLAATGAAAGVGLLAEMTALQGRPPTQVAPVVFAVQVLVPIAAAPWLASEPVRHPLAELAGVAAVIGGAWALLRSPAVLALVDADASSVDTVTGRTCQRPANDDTAATSPGRAVMTTMRPAGGSAIDRNAPTDSG